jgi:hypothetical protein
VPPPVAETTNLPSALESARAGSILSWRMGQAGRDQLGSLRRMGVQDWSKKKYSRCCSDLGAAQYLRAGTSAPAPVAADRRRPAPTCWTAPRPSRPGSLG